MSATATPDHDNTSPAGALTTIFTMPESCSSISTRLHDYGCMPPRFKEDYWESYSGYYSPAICPSGYRSACNRPSIGSDGTPYGPPIAAGENAMICCPDGYKCWADAESWCSSTYTITSKSSTYTDIFTTTSSGYAIQVRWREVDLSNLETLPLKPGSTPPPTAASTTAPASTTAAPTIPASPTSTVTSSSASGLSTGSKIGIGVGIPLALLALAGALFLLWRHRHRRRRRPHNPSSCPANNDLPEVHYTPLAPRPCTRSARPPPAASPARRR